MNDPLATYLHDHMAGSSFAIDLLESMRDEHSGKPLGQFAAALLAEVEEDKQVLQGIVDRVGKPAAALKEAAAWAGEKLSRFKLSHGASGELGTFEALEALALGIQGKLALWHALAAIAAADARLREVNLDQLIARAEEQYDRVEERRLQVARTALQPGSN